MEKCIDIYSRLIIATITFVVPIIINLLSTFTAGEKRRRQLFKETEETLNQQTAQALQEHPDNIRETISNKLKEYTLNDKNTKAELALLNPIIQFWKIFSSILICFISLILNYLIRENHFGWYTHSLSVITLLISILSYSAALFFIIRILYTISKTRKIVEN